MIYHTITRSDVQTQTVTVSDDEVEIVVEIHDDCCLTTAAAYMPEHLLLAGCQSKTPPLTPSAKHNSVISQLPN